MVLEKLVLVLYVKGDEFYLTDKKGELSLIGGGVEPGENHLECLKREFIEESGLTITKCYEFITINCFWVTRNNMNMESLANFYIVDISDEIVEPTEEGSTLVLIKREDILSKLALPYHKEAIKLYLKNNINML